MTEDEQIIEWEQREEQHNFTEACMIVNKAEWVDE